VTKTSDHMIDLIKCQKVILISITADLDWVCSFQCVNNHGCRYFTGHQMWRLNQMILRFSQILKQNHITFVEKAIQEYTAVSLRTNKSKYLNSALYIYI